jgi:SAM-dependent methyltransferase
MRTYLTSTLTSARFLVLARPGRDDAGCGVGRDLAWLESHGRQMIGMDLSPGMLRLARRVTASALVQGDLRHLPFTSIQLGGVWCSASLLHLPRADYRSALQELRRIVVLGTPLLLAVQEGIGEQWVRRRYASEERLFTLYRQPELEAFVGRCGYRRQELHRSADPQRTRLTLLAVAAG